MNNKMIGTIFCLIAVILISAKYVAAAVFMSGVTSWDAELFAAGLEYVGPLLSRFAIISLIVGIFFLGYEIYHEIRKH